MSFDISSSFSASKAHTTSGDCQSQAGGKLLAFGASSSWPQPVGGMWAAAGAAGGCRLVEIEQ